MKPMTAAYFNTLQLRDFGNGAVTGEIYATLKQRELLTRIMLKNQWSSRGVIDGCVHRLCPFCGGANPVDTGLPTDGHNQDCVILAIEQ